MADAERSRILHLDNAAEFKIKALRGAAPSTAYSANIDVSIAPSMHIGSLLCGHLNWSTVIDLYYWPTPNGWKASNMLEECGLPYRIVPVHIGRGEKFEPAFLRAVRTAGLRRW